MIRRKSRCFPTFSKGSNGTLTRCSLRACQALPRQTRWQIYRGIWRTKAPCLERSPQARSATADSRQARARVPARRQRQVRVLTIQAHLQHRQQAPVGATSETNTAAHNNHSHLMRMIRIRLHLRPLATYRPGWMSTATGKTLPCPVARGPVAICPVKTRDKVAKV